MTFLPLIYDIDHWDENINDKEYSLHTMQPFSYPDGS